MENYDQVVQQMKDFGIAFRDKDLPLKPGFGRKTCGLGGKHWHKLYIHRIKDSSKEWIVGSFGSYKDGTWERVDVDWAPLNEEERRRMAAARAAAEQAAAVERAKEIANASASALTIWRKAVAAPSTPYLDRKGVTGETFRALDSRLVLRWPGKRKGEEDTVFALPAGTLVLPLMRYDMPRDEAMRGVQFIKPDGSKIYLRHFDKPGCCIRLGTVDDETTLLLVVEGYATGCSARMAVDRRFPVFVAMDAGNLAHVVPLLRQLYPEIRILILADDDYLTRDKKTGRLNNPGRTAAKAVAKKVEACDLVWPIFKPTNRGPKDTDFNDLHAREGLDAVHRQLDAVISAMTRRYG